MINDIKTYLLPGLKELKINYSQEQIEKLKEFIKIIIEYNKKINVLGTSDVKDIIIKHLLDSLAVLKYFRNAGKTTKILDIGSGAGIPGIPFAIFSPAKFYLCESKVKKADCIVLAKSELALTNVTVLAKNVNEIKNNFDIITARAFSNSKKIINLTRRIKNKDTEYILFKGTKLRIDEELSEIINNLKSHSVHKINIPFLEAERNILNFTL